MSRRHLLGAASAAGAAVVGAGGCAGSASRPEPQDAVRGQVIAQTGDVPVGGGLVIMDAKLVLTQPEDGTFNAYTAVCTHSGCTIQQVTTQIECLCHGSRFDIATGEVLHGPATEPLESFDVTVEGTDITLDP
ncbi:Rieske Fe-S protein [Lipingzhangella halophila]|uniref:Cytochrome bc1 complex Rieske iron-sulfur subunit n=1 Tax=Lipingzhangella halophila TaxID=1783352 RepID=A0A7W7RI83_9ACTN|nr:Rieske (2Fe-2S) protein [Lipingzhangella halophila]MBB4932455.1 Rieske Fe-S protein [Lipingzhangella halophila]